MTLPAFGIGVAGVSPNCHIEQGGLMNFDQI